MALAPGARLGPYEVLAPVGVGGMGEVYKARDPRLGREVAVKVLPAGLSADPERLTRFEQEARAAAALNHPNILAVHDIGQHDGAPYIVSELLEGETLRERLHGGALPVRKAVEYAVQIAHGLAAAHEKGITHRDLKPENLFVTTEGRVKILDFGLAKLTQAEPALAGLSELPTTPPNTLPGVVLGTAGYMAPEQVRGQQADHRSDIFAFGAILYEMLSGQRAFQGETTADTMTAILKEDPPDVPAVERHIPPALTRIVDRCVEKSPAARFQTASDLAFALETVTSQSDSAAAASITRGHKTLLHNARVAWGITGSALAAVLAISTVLYFRPAVRQPVVTRLDVVTPPSTDPFSLALSPDGRQLAFVATAEGSQRLWVRSLDQVTARPLAGTEGASAPFWSPEGHAIGFFADGKLKRVDPGGGAPRVLADAAIPRGGTWNRDNVIVFSPRVNTGLMRVAATGGAPTAVTRLVPGQGTHRWPQFLPDGRQFLFLVALGQPDTRGIYLGSLDGGEPRRVLVADASAAYAPPGYVLVVSEGTLVAYHFDAARGSISGEPVAVAQSVGVDSGGATGLSAFSVSAAGVLAHRSGATARRQLVWVDRSGKVLGVLGPPDEGAPATPELAPDGSRVALLRNVQGNPDIWLLEVGRGITSRFTFDPGVDGNPIWSPDGRRIVFGSARNGRWDLFEKPADGATDEQPLLVSAQDKAPQDWSRDGRFLLYAVQDPKTGSDLWALPLTGERKPFPAVQASFDEVHGKFSPDGRWLAYVSNETRGYEVYVRPFPGPGGQRQVSTGGGIFPRWRHDGKELFYVTLDNRVMAVSIQIGSDARTLSPGTSVALFQSPRLAAGGNVGIGSYLSGAPYAVMPEGRFLMDVITDDASASPITVVLNWTAGLKK